MLCKVLLVEDDSDDLFNWAFFLVHFQGIQKKLLFRQQFETSKLGLR